jgi:hypothetical protein
MKERKKERRKEGRAKNENKNSYEMYVCIYCKQ